MIARFLQNIVVNDIEKNMEMNIDKGDGSERVRGRIL